MQINLDPGEDLTIVTPRGNVVLGWIYDSEDLLVLVGFDPEKSKAEALGHLGQKFALASDLTIACRIQLSETEDDRHV